MVVKCACRILNLSFKGDFSRITEKRHEPSSSSPISSAAYDFIVKNGDRELRCEFA